MEQTYLPIRYDPLLVGLSFLIAIWAAYTAQATINRLRLIGSSKSWLWLGATAFGLGVWAMQFTAISALRLDRLVVYDPLLTFAPGVFAILGSAAAFQQISRPHLGWPQILGSGIFLGAGIGIMQYVGILALRLDARLGFDFLMVGVSVLLAVALGIFVIWTFTSPAFNQAPFRHLVTAIIAGSAIPFVHFAAMWAVRLTSTGSNEISAMIAGGSLFSLNIFLLLAIAVMGVPLFLASLLEAPQEKVQEAEA